jgi:Tfp pilus assembly protein FimT
VRRGITVPELLTVTVILGVLASVVTPPLARGLDRAAVHEASDRYAALHETTRQLAISRGSLARLELEPALKSGTVSWRRAGTTWDTILSRPLGSARLLASRRIVTFSPLGIGFGASNTRIIFSRGAAVETLTVSRTGRLKRR